MRPVIRWTNKLNIPEPIALAVQRIESKYSPGHADFTTTELTKPPRPAAILRGLAERGEQLVVDVSDRVYTMMGSAIHYVLEETFSDSDSHITEARHYREIIFERNGYIIGGQIDLYDLESKRLWDWKGTKFRTFRDGVPIQYQAQLNINAWILRAQGWHPETLVSGGIWRDYSAITCEFKAPHSPAGGYPVALWTDEKVEEYLRERIRVHLEARQRLPLCTDEERWKDPAKYAVHSKMAKKAKRLLNSPREAEDWIAAQKSPKGLYIVERQAEPTMCMYYCDARDVCSQWQAEKKLNHGYR